MRVHRHGYDGGACKELQIGECMLRPGVEEVDEAARLIKMAQAVKNSLWYEHARRSLSESEKPTLAIVLALVDRLAIYSANADGPAAGDQRRQTGGP